MLAFLVPPLLLATARPRQDWLARARERVEQQDWQGAAEILRDALQRSAGGPEVSALLGEVDLELERPDEAAHWLDQAASETDDPAEARRLGRLLRRADPLAPRRAALLERIAKTLYRSATELARDGHDERALDLLLRVEPIARGSLLHEVRALLVTLRDRRREVDLDAASKGPSASGPWPLIERRTEHYFVRANLEPEVTERVGDVMDDIFASYVEIYFGGDAGRATERPATIRIYPTSQEMLASWHGEGAPEGWWSPGEWRVVCYDTRTSSGTLDTMLETLFHEASHQFMTLRSRGGSVPAWLNEGTASFFEGARAMADHRVLWPQAARGRLASLVAQLGREGSPALAEVIGWPGPGSYEPEHYPYGWGLVFFLQQYEDPSTLAYVYRPLYQEYMERIATRGGDARALFDQIFLGPDAPLEFASLEEFEGFWSEWIRNSVYPLYNGPDQRELRMERVRRTLAAAEKAGKRRGSRRHPRPSARELELRALGDVEYVRTELAQQGGDLEVLTTQAEVLERLGREQSAAPILEELLDRADAGEFELSEEDYAAYEERLYRIDRKNAELRAARAKAHRLARSVARLLDEYDPEVFLLRRYTLARVAGLALDDQADLLPRSVTLREEARAAGLLLGTIQDVVGAPADWVTIFDDGDPAALETGLGRVSIEGVRPTARISTAIAARGEYEVRATLKRAGRVRRGTVAGLVVSGTVDGDWIVAGIDARGRLSLRRMDFGPGGGVTDTLLQGVDLDPPVGPGETDVRIAVHAFPEGRLGVTVGDRERIEVALEEPLPATGHVGIYAKDGRTELSQFVLESYP